MNYTVKYLFVIKYYSENRGGIVGEDYVTAFNLGEAVIEANELINSGKISLDRSYVSLVDLKVWIEYSNELPISMSSAFSSALQKEQIKALTKANLNIEPSIIEKLETLTDEQFESFKKLKLILVHREGCLWPLLKVLIIPPLIFSIFASFFGNTVGYISLFLSLFGIIYTYIKREKEGNINPKIIDNWLNELKHNGAGKADNDEKSEKLRIKLSKIKESRFKTVEKFIEEFFEKSKLIPVKIKLGNPGLDTERVCCLCGFRGRMFAGYLDGSYACSKCTGAEPQALPCALPESQDESKTDNRTLDELLAEINNLIGLSTLKGEISSIINQIKIEKVRKEKGLSSVAMSNHLVFMGNPGTGKTTVARILANVYCKLGLLSKGHLVETDRSGLVAGYVGQTAIKTKEIADTAKGGILFIDEAYSLSAKNASSEDYGKEAIDTLLKIMEDNRDDFVVIVAGYPNEMKEFLKTNPGLESRFNNFIDFEDYNGSELYEIFTGMCKKHKYVLEPATIEPLTQYFANLYKNRGANYANARDVRNFFEKALKRQSNRLASVSNLTDTELITITKEDLFSIFP
jgi:hypothetical protein